MRLLRPARLSAGALGALCMGVAIAATGVTTASISVAGSTAASAPDDDAGPGTSQVTLITGDVVTLTRSADSRQSASVDPARDSGPAGLFHTFNRGTDTYVVPQTAVPYLGTTLDESLFNVTRLSMQPATANQVRLTFRTRSASSELPGVKVESRAGLKAQGSLTPVTARAFGAALAEQFDRDNASPTHTTGLFANATKISAVNAAPPVAGPIYAMKTLTIKTVTADGRTDTSGGGWVSVVNVDDMTRYSYSVLPNRGSGKLSLPAGNYSISQHGYEAATKSVRLIVEPQVSIRKDTTVTLDQRKATSKVSVQTPTPTRVAVQHLKLGRTDASGVLYENATALSRGNDITYYVQPTTDRVTIGRLHFSVYQRLFSPEDAATNESYNLVFPSEGAIGADQSHVVDANDLATVTNSYPAQEVAGLAHDSVQSSMPWETEPFTLAFPVPTPNRVVGHYTARPDVKWQETYDSAGRSIYGGSGTYVSGWRSYQPASVAHEGWRSGPIHPRLLQEAFYYDGVTRAGTICPACTSGDTLQFVAAPFGDNSPAHFGVGDNPYIPDSLVDQSVTTTVYADGVEVGRSTAEMIIGSRFSVPSDASVYRLDVDTQRSSPTMRLSTDARTSWTVKASAPRSAPPSGWLCDAPWLPGSGTCEVLPLITNEYDLPTDDFGRLPAGPVTASIGLGHLAGAETVGFTSVNVSVSFDGGATWQPAGVTANVTGSYGVAFDVPSASDTDGYGAIRVSAQDSHGGTFDQTILKAFAIAGS